MKIIIRQKYKSIPYGLEFELPMFTVLTGENGSGKTHLFEAIAHLSDKEVNFEGRLLRNINYIPFGGLIPEIDQQCDSVQVSQNIKKVWNSIRNIKEQQSTLGGEYNYSGPPENDPIITLPSISQQYKNAILDISKKVGVLPSKLTEDHISDQININAVASNNLFNIQFALIFKSYHVRYIDNKLNQIYTKEEIHDAPLFLDDEEFKAKYGEAPWELVNSILEKLRLPYTVNNPLKTMRDTTFIFKLTHQISGIEIDTKDLSTGERTLMSLALAVYNSNDIMGKPELLILDEPDASLHPSMSKIMLDIIENEIVGKNKIPVLLSTHSPTTIACSPASALYKISVSDKTPVQCTLDDSMKILTYSIPNLRVSIEHRRQVFVEHTYDVEYYEALFDIISRKEKFTVTPQFLPPHTLNGSNCDAVLEITRKLRDMGNTNVYGLIDRDINNSPEKQVIILGQGKRYAIENYIFEPHFIGLYLIYKNFISPKELGLDKCFSYVDVTKKIEVESSCLQTIVDNIQNKIEWGDAAKYSVTSQLLDGTEIMMRKEIFEMKGHALESLVKKTWNILNSIRSNNDGDSALKKDIINTVINDFPNLISKDISKTFSSIR